MLTDIEKQILGYMVDLGYLRGQLRIDAGSSDETARDLITSFKSQIQLAFPQQISCLEEQKQRTEDELIAARDLLALVSL